MLTPMGRLGMEYRPVPGRYSFGYSHVVTGNYPQLRKKRMYAMAFLTALAVQPPITVNETDSAILVETDVLKAKINKKGYMSGIAAGFFVDKKTGAKDAGFGLHI